MTTTPLQSPSVRSNDLARLLNIQEIYHEPAARDYPRGQEIFAKYPDAQLIEVASHWNIPALHGNEGAVEDWNRYKRGLKGTLVDGLRELLEQQLPYCNIRYAF